MKIRKIALGWWYVLKSKFGYISPEIQELAVVRKTICFNCPHFTKYKTCRICGCVISAKSQVLTENCPDNRWKPIHYFGDNYSSIIICREVPPLLRTKLYDYLGSTPEEISLEAWEQFLNEF